MTNTSGKKGNLRTIVITFCVFLLGTLSLLSLLCYLSFDQNYREVKQSYYAAQCDQIISDMESGIKYGKSLERYYGIEDVFARTQALFEEVDMEVSILDREGATLYATYESGSPIDRIVASDEGQTLARDTLEDDSYALIADNGYEVLMMPVRDGDKQVGSFLLSYPTSVYDAQRLDMAKDTVLLLGAVFVIGLILFLGYFFVLHRHLSKLDTSMRRVMLFAVPSGLLLAMIVITGFASYVFFQNHYETAIREDVGSVVEYVGMMTEEVYEKGVTYEEMTGLEEYLAEKVRQMPMLVDMRISSVLYDSDTVLGQASSDIVTEELETSGMPLRLEAFVSDQYVNEKMRDLFLIFLATFIFCVVIIVEMIRLPEMLAQRRDPEFDKENTQTYEYFSRNIRIVSFLQTTARYLYLPYSALLITQWGQSIGGLGIGVTAALPLAAEYLAHVVAMALCPGWIKQPDKRCRLFSKIFLAVVLAANIGCFLTHSAIWIIVLRLIGGFAFAGLVYIVTLLAGIGEDSLERHNENQAQLNAGLIGGNMCGAGIAAIIVALTGYSFAYLVSAMVFVLFGISLLRLMPWRLLEQNAAQGKGIVARKPQRLRLRDYMHIVFSPSVMRYFILIMMPFFFAVLYTATLIPTLITGHESDILLSYCYIANGLAGFYLGPRLSRLLGGHISLSQGLVGALVLGFCGVVVIGLPPFMVMVLVSSAIFGTLDGYGTPLAMDGFLALPAVHHRIDEITASALYLGLSNVVMAVAPVFIGFFTERNATMTIWGLAIAYLICAVLSALMNRFSKTNG